VSWLKNSLQISLAWTQGLSHWQRIVQLLESGNPEITLCEEAAKRVSIDGGGRFGFEVFNGCALGGSPPKIVSGL
jgi:hypothetical protein